MKQKIPSPHLSSSANLQGLSAPKQRGNSQPLQKSKRKNTVCKIKIGHDCLKFEKQDCLNSPHHNLCHPSWVPSRASTCPLYPQKMSEKQLKTSSCSINRKKYSDNGQEIASSFQFCFSPSPSHPPVSHSRLACTKLRQISS